MDMGNGAQMIFAGVGPGDPQLITLKAVEAIEHADVLAVADSGLGGQPVALKIVEKWVKAQRLLRLETPMQGERTQWRAAHQRAAELLMEELNRGRSVVYPVLGDPSLYASSSYLMELIQPRFACEVIPGVPAMCAAAAALRQPLAEGREPLSVHPGYRAEEPIPQGNLVIMKAGRSLPEIREALRIAGRLGYLVQDLGMPGERVCPLDEAPLEERQSYFSTVLVKPRRDGTPQ